VSMSKSRLDQTLIAEPPVQLGRQRTHPSVVGHLASPVAEVELAQVPGKMHRRDVMVRAVQRPLELREEPFRHIRADVPSHVLALGMVDRLVRRELLADLHVVVCRVGEQLAIRHVDLLADDLAERGSGDIGDDSGTDLTGNHVDQCENGSLVGLALLGTNALPCVPVLRLAADPRLVRHDGAAHGTECTVSAHGLSDAVEHVPCRLGGHSVAALDLAGTDSVLRCAHVEHDQHPRTNRNLGCVHNRSSEHRTLLATRTTLPHPTLAHRALGRLPADPVVGDDQVHLRPATVGANRRVAPPQLLHVEIGVSFGDDVPAEGGNGDSCDSAHTLIIAGGCDSQTCSEQGKGRRS
jgi:hypothetical protein